MVAFVEKRQNAKLHMWVTGLLPSYPDPEEFLRVNASLQNIHWRNATYNQMVEQARQITDQAERLKIFAKADKILISEAAILPLIYGGGHMLVKPWVKGHLITGHLSWLWKNIVIEPH